MTLQQQIDALPDWPPPIREVEQGTIEAALARLALARKWIAGAPHHYECYGLTTCTCGRDALLEALQEPV